MNLQLALNAAQFTDEHRRLWHDGRVWFVNCVAIEAGWFPINRPALAESRRQRDAMLAALAETW